MEKIITGVKPVDMARRIIGEIAQEMRDGDLPEDIKTFSELHEHCDANEYFDEFPDKEDEVAVERHCILCNAAADMVNVWLKWRRDDAHLAAYGFEPPEPDDRAVCRICGATISDADHMDNDGRCDDCCDD